MVHPDRCSPSRTSMMSSVCQQSDVPSRWQRPAATAHSSRCWNCWVPASPPAIKTVTELLLIQTYDIRLRNRKQYITCRWSVTSIINHQSTKRSYINKEIINYVSFASGDVVPGPTDAAAADSLRKSDSMTPCYIHVTWPTSINLVSQQWHSRQQQIRLRGATKLWFEINLKS